MTKWPKAGTRKDGVRTRCGTFIKTEPGACIYSGFAQEITPYELRQRIADGSLTEVIARHEAQPGDVIALSQLVVSTPSAKVSYWPRCSRAATSPTASSDYNRLGNGTAKPRELHVDLAQQALNYKVDSQYRTRYEEKNNKCHSGH